MAKKKVQTGKVLFFVVAILIIIVFLISRIGSEIKIDSDGSIALIPIEGVISLGTSSGIPFQQHVVNADTIVKDIKTAGETDSIKAVVIEINSPGGTAVASKQIADAIDRLDKPSVAVIREIGTSGAYWIASATDKIVADDLSITGSIGVIASYLEFSGLFEDHGIEYQRLISGKYKDIGTPYKNLTDEEKELLQERLDEVHDFFVKEVKENRGVEDNGELFTGIFFLGTEAKELGLVDELGDLETGMSLARELAGISKGEVIEFREEKGLFDFFSRISASAFYFMGRGIGSELLAQEQKLDIELK